MPRRSWTSLLAFAVIAGSLAFAPVAARSAVALRTPCDPMDVALCLLPFPNDRFTRPDPTTDTGKRIDFQLPEMPRSVAGKPIDPAEWNRNDGFSPGSMILTYVPGLDLHQTWGTASISVPGPNDPADQIADIGRYRAATAPILVIDATTGERWPFWSELDTNQFTPDQTRVLIVRPAKNFLEGHRYLVAMRNMKDASGATIGAGPVFSAIRDNADTLGCDPGLSTLQADEPHHVACVIDEVQAAEVARGNAFNRSQLYLAWDFTVASERNLSERMLHIRDDAFGKLGQKLTDSDTGTITPGSRSPQFSVTKVQPNGDGSRRVEGTITVPNYLWTPAGPPADPIAGLPGQSVPGGRFHYGSDGLPEQNPIFPTVSQPWVCTVPPAAMRGAGQAHATIYGHGLLGSRNEAAGGSTARDRDHNFMPCAVNWLGFAENDVANAVLTLADPSNMGSMMDRTQQGFLGMLYLGRALKHADGFISNAAFKAADGAPLYVPNELFYDGNSQGGILGGALTALSIDFTRATLGVLGMNYSTLLNRSSDWEARVPPAAVTDCAGGFPGHCSSDPTDYVAYSEPLYTMFPNKIEQQLVMALLQMLWDRGEADGYVQHMTDDPLPHTPRHQALMHSALGDYQVTNFAAMAEARTVGARIMDTSLDASRNWSVSTGADAPNHFWGLEAMPRNGDGTIAPWTGSALVFFDHGNLLPPNGNVPPSETLSPNDVIGDPHGKPRASEPSIVQKEHFYLTGEIIDVEGGAPYVI